METAKPISVLHLEDEALMIELVRLRLEHAGIRANIHPATNKAEFLHKFPGDSYDVILLDYQLPDFDGISALRIIRAHDQDTPVIMVSGALDEEAVITSLRLGATDYVLKNNIQRLVPCINRALQERERNRTHKNTLADLQETKIRLSDIAANLPGGLYQFVRRIDGSYAIPWCSEGFERIYGVSAQQIKDNATPAFEHIVDDDLANVLHSIELSASHLQKWNEKFRLKNAEGTPRWVQATSQPRLMEDGSIIWNGLILDITEQKHQEDELLRFRDHLQDLVDQRTEIVKQQAQIIDQIYDAVISMDLTGCITSWNKGAERIFGYSCEEMTEQPLTAVCAQEYVEFVRNECLQVLQQQQALKTEIGLIRNNGERFSGYLSMSPLRESTGEVIGLIVYAMDISKIKQTESALHNSEAKYRAVVETAVDGIITIDERGIIETFNHAAETIFGYPAEAVIGQNITLLMPQSYAAHHQDYVHNYLRHGSRHVIGTQRELSGLHKDGTVFPMQLSVSEMRIDGQRKFTGMVRNITQIKQTKQALLSSERFSRNILNSLTDHIAVLNKAGVIVQVNDAWDEFANLNQGNACTVGIGSDYLAACRDAASQTEEIASRACSGIESVLEQQCPKFTMEYPCHSPRQQRWFLMSVVPLLGEAGGAVVAHMNITERKEIENQLVAAKNEAEQASRAKSEFLSSMSHELRTPLNAILGYTQLMLMDDVFNAEQLQSIDEINKAGEHLLHLISDLLDLAKIEAGHMQLNFEDLSLGQIIDECHQLVLPTAERRNISITCCGNGNCCGATVHADRVRLKQVILNILSNAVKYNRDGGEVILNIEQASDYLRLSIKDTGEGIPEQHMHKLFNAFNRLGAESTAIEGTGIGLVIAKNLIELMGGRIQVDSQPGRGATFCIDVLSTNASDRSSALSLTSPAEDDNQIAVNDSVKTILYIEDNAANTRLVEHVLKHRSNLKLLTASEGTQGLEIALREKPDLVLLDITLPGMDGYEVLSRLQNNKQTQRIPVIAVSANAMSRDIERGLNAGFVQYITKPIDVNKLLSAVDLTFDPKQGAA